MAVEHFSPTPNPENQIPSCIHILEGFCSLSWAGYQGYITDVHSGVREGEQRKITFLKCVNVSPVPHFRDVCNKFLFYFLKNVILQGRTEQAMQPGDIPMRQASRVSLKAPGNSLLYQPIAIYP